MTTQADLLREIDAMANALMVPLGMADVGDWCSRSGARKVGVTVIVDRATQTIGSGSWGGRR